MEIWQGSETMYKLSNTEEYMKYIQFIELKHQCLKLLKYQRILTILKIYCEVIVLPGQVDEHLSWHDDICDSCCWCWDIFRRTGNICCFRNCILWKCNVIFKTLSTDSEKQGNDFLLLLLSVKHQELSGAMMNLWIRSPIFLYSLWLNLLYTMNKLRNASHDLRFWKVRCPSWPVTDNFPI